MGLFKLLLSPVTGTLDAALWVAEKVHDAALDSFHDPALIKKELILLEQQLLAGEITEEEYEAAEELLLMRLKRPDAEDPE